jgi:hypothetical protein
MALNLASASASAAAAAASSAASSAAAAVRAVQTVCSSLAIRAQCLAEA